MDTLPPELIHRVLHFLPVNADVLHCLLTNSLFTIPRADILQRQKAQWGKSSIAELAIVGSLRGVQYLHSVTAAAATVGAGALDGAHGLGALDRLDPYRNRFSSQRSAARPRLPPQWPVVSPWGTDGCLRAS